jgi:hypothetical protein
MLATGGSITADVDGRVVTVLFLASRYTERGWEACTVMHCGLTERFSRSTRRFCNYQLVFWGGKVAGSQEECAAGGKSYAADYSLGQGTC